MNPYQILYKYIFFLLIVMFISCEDEIQVDLRTAPPVLVIEGKITADSLAEVRITKTKSFAGTNEYTSIKDAFVSLSDDTGNWEQLHVNDSGSYVSEVIRGKERVTYTLIVAYEEKEYKAVSRMPPLVELDSLTLFEFPVLDYPSPMVHFTDPKGEENNYYRYVVYINGVRPDINERLISAEFMDGLPIHQMIGVFTDDDDDPIEQGDLIEVEMQCVDKGVYKFWESLSRIENSLTNPETNIEGGALGYFSAYSFDVKSIVAEW